MHPHPAPEDSLISGEGGGGDKSTSRDLQFVHHNPRGGSDCQITLLLTKKAFIALLEICFDKDSAIVPAGYLPHPKQVKASPVDQSQSAVLGWMSFIAVGHL